ncbi:MAG TPA: MBL fold metallo-hydrolase [Rubrivivax sp.]|nr:MBL fold metallo-hydrolase [Rubrivivax sp.]
MKVHHLNCVSSCPLGGRLMDGRSASILQRGQLCCHCLLVESNAGLVLVDTGFGLRDVRDPRSRLSGFFLKLLSPDFREEMTAIRQVERLGFAAADVRHIVLTHLDFDHAGGLDDFPQAQVHMMSEERRHAVMQQTWLDRQRYRPQQWSDRSRWQVHGEQAGRGDNWCGFTNVQGGGKLPDDVLLVPLPGHTFGHAGVAVRGEGGWVLQAGDAYFDAREMDIERPRCRLGLRMYQTLMEKDRRARLDNQQRLRDLRRDHGEVRVFCAHDPDEFEQLAGRAMSASVEPVQAVRQRTRALI